MAATAWTPTTGNASATYRLAQCPRCNSKWQDANATTAQQCGNCGGAMAGAAILFLPSP